MGERSKGIIIKYEYYEKIQPNFYCYKYIDF
jgi:hypothetical protein